MLQRPKPTEQKPPAYEQKIQPPQQMDPYHTINQLTLRIQELQLQQQHLSLQTQQAVCQRITPNNITWHIKAICPMTSNTVLGSNHISRICIADQLHTQMTKNQLQSVQTRLKDLGVQQDGQWDQTPSEEEVQWTTPNKRSLKTHTQTKRN